MKVSTIFTTFAITMSILALNVNAHHDYHCDCSSDGGGDCTCYQPDSGESPEFDGDHKVKVNAGGVSHLDFYCSDSSLYPGSVDYHIKNNAVSCTVTECSKDEHQITCTNTDLSSSHHVDVESYECKTGKPKGDCGETDDDIYVPVDDDDDRRFLFEEDESNNAINTFKVVILIILVIIGSIMSVLFCCRVGVKEEKEGFISSAPTTNIV